jgi:hypothetical protein
MGKKFAVLGLLAVMALALAGSAASDTAVTIDGGWLTFSFAGPGSTIDGSPFTFNSSAPVLFTAVDGFVIGDQFGVTDGATSLADTSVPGSGGGFAFDGDSSLANPAYSRGRYALSAGSHSIGMTAVASPFGGGAAFLRVETMTSANCTGGAWELVTSPTFASEAACLAFLSGPKPEQNQFLCYSRFQVDPGVWDSSQASTLLGNGYWIPDAVQGDTLGSQTVLAGGYALVCNPPSGYTPTGNYIDASNDVFSGARVTDYKADHGSLLGLYPVFSK